MNRVAKILAVGVVGAGIGAAALGTAGSILGFGFWDFLFTDEKLYGVKLIPQGNSGVLQVNVEKGRKCKNNKHDGCMLFEEGKVGVIGFYLPGPKEKIRCSDDPTKDAKKVITKIELTSTEGSGPSKGNFEADVADWLKYEAFTGVSDDGVVYEATKETGMSRVALINSNSHQDGQLKSFWYRVTVTDCDDPTKKWVSDPRGDNEGLW